jgi:hypothetical protein
MPQHTVGQDFIVLLGIIDIYSSCTDRKCALVQRCSVRYLKTTLLSLDIQLMHSLSLFNSSPIYHLNSKAVIYIQVLGFVRLCYAYIFYSLLALKYMQSTQQN